MNQSANTSNIAFRKIDEHYLDEASSNVTVFEHIATGARCIFLKNQDDNRVFYIAFKTPPTDHTGVFHILEHSVLCGSRKYPVKEPFIELAKGSLNTFLNALTYPDKTVYPVASKNIIDFKNLVDVYLDAVLYPNIYTNPSIFHQEGWHYDITSPNDEIALQGIVYNEMKGAYSSPDSILFDAITQALFPDTIYRFESGGKPEDIPQLGYEQFLNEHRKYYHPSNAYIYLYGDLDIEEWLQYLDLEYLSAFPKRTDFQAIPMQTPFKERVSRTVSYSVGQEDNTSNKTYLSLSFLTGKTTDPVRYMSLDILEHILLGTPASPLKKALIEADIGEEIDGFVDLNLQESLFGVIAKNANPEKREKFLSVIQETLQGLVEKGIEQDLIQGSINSHEFQLREADYHGFPKGLFYGLSIMDSWLYEGKPCTHLAFNQTLDLIRKQSKEGMFEKMIQDLMLNNPHSADVMAVPEKGLEDKNEKLLGEKLVQLKKETKVEDITSWIEDCQKLKIMQEAPDSELALNSIPLLKREDINPQSEILALEIEKDKEDTFLLHPVSTQNILYLNLYFDISSLGAEELPYVNILSNLLSRMGTEKYSYSDLSNQLYLHTGGLNISAMAINNYHDISKFDRFMCVQAKALTPSFPKLLELIEQIIFHTVLDHPKRIKELMSEMKSGFESSIHHQGHLLAAKRLNSYFSHSGQWNEKLSGLSFYHFLLDHEPLWEKSLDQLIQPLQQLAQKIFSPKNLICSITGPKADLAKGKSQLSGLLDRMDRRESIQALPYIFCDDIRNEGISTSSKVQYVLKGYNYKKLRFPYHGALQVLESLSSLDYLWNRIRIMGGAYGAFIKISRNGRIVIGSYRDPKLKETLDAFDQLGAYMSKIDLSERELRKYLIGTMSQLDAPLTPSMMGQKSDIQYLSGVTQEEIQQERDEILSVSLKDIHTLSEYISACTAMNCHCVLGNEKKLNDHRQLFGSIVKAFR
jgi:hypothetical protein